MTFLKYFICCVVCVDVYRGSLWSKVRCRRWVRPRERLIENTCHLVADEPSETQNTLNNDVIENGGGDGNDDGGGGGGEVDINEKDIRKDKDVIGVGVGEAAGVRCKVCGMVLPMDTDEVEFHMENECCGGTILSRDSGSGSGGGTNGRFRNRFRGFFSRTKSETEKNSLLHLDSPSAPHYNKSNHETFTETTKVDTIQSETNDDVNDDKHNKEVEGQVEGERGGLRQEDKRRSFSFFSGLGQPLANPNSSSSTSSSSPSSSSSSSSSSVTSSSLKCKSQQQEEEQVEIDVAQLLLQEHSKAEKLLVQMAMERELIERPEHQLPQKGEEENT